ncbi:cytochrome P450 89A2-like [Mercurialis annua]|uniref:cytochrome P450 89A2-like n=1 Tax=Mercurialis annua TaxID=3986 RepID=UPI0024ACE211|nr:cytochrome P450 89A2-like [Mercurialis annua]
METWFLIVVTLATSFLIKSLVNLFSQPKNQTQCLPPGPPKFPIVGSLVWLRKSFREFESTLGSLHKKLGPVITLYIGSRPTIFIADRSLAHQALIQSGAVFANRPPSSSINKITNCNQHNISSSFYGPTWRLFRRNVTSEIFHPSRVKSYSHARKWSLQILFERLESQSKSGDHVVGVLGNFQFSMFCLLVLMCFGDQLDQKQIEEIERLERGAIVNIHKLDKLNIMPRLTKILFRKSWSEFLQIQKQREEALISLIRARKKANEERRINNSNDDYVVSYVDTLFDLQLPDERRKLTEKEMVALCNEFLNAGSDTTSTALQWIMANLVKYPEIQEKLYMEIIQVVGDGEKEVKEEDLHKMPYLKGVILEGLRKHPPGHFVLPHAVTEDIVLDKFMIPKNATINFMVAEMGWDPKVWEDPMAFKPERFTGNDRNGEVFDITGSREIKMMPFGVGRRMCPAYGLALLHLEYFVANLVSKFQWKAVDGDEIDLSEKLEFTTVMKNPLQALISPRFHN